MATVLNFRDFFVRDNTILGVRGGAGVSFRTEGITSTPVITVISPAEGPIGRFDSVVVEVTCAGPISFIVFSVLLGDINVDELIYKTGTGFSARYAGNVIENITDGFRFTLMRAGGWPVGTDVFDADAVSDSGGIA